MTYRFIDCLTILRLWGLNSKYWPACSSFKFLLPLKAFMNIRRTETGIEVLMTGLQLNALFFYVL